MSGLKKYILLLIVSAFLASCSDYAIRQSPIDSLGGANDTYERNLLPEEDNTYNLGAAGEEWASIYFERASGTESLELGTCTGSNINFSGGDLCVADDADIEDNLVIGGRTSSTDILTVGPDGVGNSVIELGGGSSIFALGRDDADGFYKISNSDSLGTNDAYSLDVVNGSSTTTATSTSQGKKVGNLISCDTIDTTAEGHLQCGTDANTVYTASGTLLDLTGTTFSVNEGTLTDTKICTFESGTGLQCTTNPTAEGGNVSTSTPETSGQVSFWTSTAATPATLGSDSAFLWDDALNRLTFTNASTTGTTTYATNSGFQFGDPAQLSAFYNGLDNYIKSDIRTSSTADAIAATDVGFRFTHDWNTDIFPVVGDSEVKDGDHVSHFDFAIDSGSNSADDQVFATIVSHGRIHAGLSGEMPGFVIFEDNDTSRVWDTGWAIGGIQTSDGAFTGLYNRTGLLVWVQDGGTRFGTDSNGMTLGGSGSPNPFRFRTGTTNISMEYESGALDSATLPWFTFENRESSADRDTPLAGTRFMQFRQRRSPAGGDDLTIASIWPYGALDGDTGGFGVQENARLTLDDSGGLSAGVQGNTYSWYDSGNAWRGGVVDAATTTTSTATGLNFLVDVHVEGGGSHSTNAVCYIDTSGELGHCTDAVDGSGQCTCVAN